MFLTHREPGVPLSLFRSYPLPFPPPFLLHCSLITLPSLLCLFYWSISAVVSGSAVALSSFFSPPFLLYCSLPFLFFYVFFIDLYLLYFPGRYPSFFSHCSHMFLTRRESGVSLFLFRPYPLPFSPPFLLYCSLITPFLLCFFHWSISAIISGEAFYLLIIGCFPHCSHMFLTRREPGVPLSLFRPYPFPFSPPFLLYCSLLFLSSMSVSLIYICCSFRGRILSVVFTTVAICVWPAGNLECPCLFSDLSSSLFSSFSSILFLTLPFLLCLFHWSISAVVSGEAFYLLFSLL